MDYLLELYNAISQMAKTNPVVGGVIALWGVAAVSFFCMRIPRLVWNFVEARFTTSLTFNNMGMGLSEVDFYNFLKWFADSRWSKLTRNFSYDSYNWSGEVNMLGAGYGTHFFMYAGRPFIFTRTKLDTGGVFVQRQEVKIIGLTRSRDVMERLLTEFKAERMDESMMRVFHWVQGCWDAPTLVRKRKLSTVVQNDGVKAHMLQLINEFRESRDWYEDRGFPYKMGFGLYGPTGTGKTSLVRALAAFFNAPVYCLNLNTVDDTGLIAALRQIPRGAFLLIEDIDTVSTTQSRDGYSVLPPIPPPLSRLAIASDARGENNVAMMGVAPARLHEPEGIVRSRLSLSGLLNGLGGIVDLDGIVIFGTSNHPERLDSALLRRFEHLLRIEPLNAAAVAEYVGLVFPDMGVPSNVQFQTITGCELEKKFSSHRSDFESFIKSITREPLDVQ